MKKLAMFTLCFALAGTLLCGCRSKAPEETAGPTDDTGTSNTGVMDDFTDSDGMSRSRRFNDQY